MFKFKIVTPDGITYDDAVESVSIPTETGEITILEHHAAIVSVLRAGELEVRKKDHTTLIVISGGVVEVREGGDVYVLADTAERAEHIDIERAEAAKKRAEELIAQATHADDVDFARIQAAIEKELARIRVGKKYRNIK